jgi:hypothetical protein
MHMSKFLAGLVAIVILLGGISVGVAEPSQYSLIANDLAQHTSFLASNVEWHAGAIAIITNIKYLTTKQVAERYSIDPRSVPRRVAEQLLPKPYYFGTRFPRWDIAELDENDRKLASVRVPNVGALAAAKAKADKKAERKAAKPKPAEKKPARPRTACAAAAASPDDHAAASPEFEVTA